MHLSPHVESKDDDIYLDEASTPGSLGSAGGLNSASNRQRALEEQKKRLMRKQQMRRGSAGTVQANRAFTGAAKKIPLTKTGSSFRNFSAPKAIDPLEGDDDDESSSGLRKTGYADSFRGSSRNASGPYGGVYEALHQPVHQSSSSDYSEHFADARVANVKSAPRAHMNQDEVYEQQQQQQQQQQQRDESESKFAGRGRDTAESKRREPSAREIIDADEQSPEAADDVEEADVRRKGSSSSKSRSQRKKESSKSSSSKSRSGNASKTVPKSSSRRAVDEEDSADLSPEPEQSQPRRRDSASSSRRQQRAASKQESLVAARQDEGSASEDETSAEMIVPRPPKKSARVKKASEKTRKSRKNSESKSAERDDVAGAKARATASPDDSRFGLADDARLAQDEDDSEVEHKASEDEFGGPQLGLRGSLDPPQIDFSDMRAFLMSPVPRAYGTIQCYIERNKSGAHKLYPEFQVFLKDGDRFLMSGKKRSKNRTTNYMVTMDPKDYNRDSPNCLGKLRSNFIGTEFQIFDKGINPKNADPDSLHVGTTPVREELGAILYNSNVLGSRGPRKMKVAVPVVDETTNKRKNARSSKKGDELLNRFKDRDMCDLVELINKPPRWNDHVGAYVLNFNGRVTMASVKNFQLITAENEDDVILTFGRCGTNLFSMDVAWPLSPFQAFCIAMSSASSKLACE